MLSLTGANIYLSVLEREHCRTLWDNLEYDYELGAEPLNIGLSVEKADEWFDEIQKLQGSKNVRLGIFLKDGTVIGDVALQGLDWCNRACDLGLGIAKIAYRGKGYGREAALLILDYAFSHLGMERVGANTLAVNIPAQKSLEGLGFVLEGRARQSVYLGGEKHDKLSYGILAKEFRTKWGK